MAVAIIENPMSSMFQVYKALDKNVIYIMPTNYAIPGGEKKPF